MNLEAAMAAELDGYNVPGYLQDKACEVARLWAADDAVRGTGAIEESVKVPEGAGAGTREQAERQAVATVWQRCAEDGVAPTHRPYVEWQQVWDPSDPAKPRLMAMEVTAHVRVRTLAPAPEPEPEPEPEGSTDG